MGFRDQRERRFGNSVHHEDDATTRNAGARVPRKRRFDFLFPRVQENGVSFLYSTGHGSAGQDKPVEDWKIFLVQYTARAARQPTTQVPPTGKPKLENPYQYVTRTVQQPSSTQVSKTAHFSTVFGFSTCRERFNLPFRSRFRARRTRWVSVCDHASTRFSGIFKGQLFSSFPQRPNPRPERPNPRRLTSTPTCVGSPNPATRVSPSYPFFSRVPPVGADL